MLSHFIPLNTNPFVVKFVEHYCGHVSRFINVADLWDLSEIAVCIIVCVCVCMSEPHVRGLLCGCADVVACIFVVVVGGNYLVTFLGPRRACSVI